MSNRSTLAWLHARASRTSGPKVSNRLTPTFLLSHRDLMVPRSQSCQNPSVSPKLSDSDRNILLLKNYRQPQPSSKLICKVRRPVAGKSITSDIFQPAADQLKNFYYFRPLRTINRIWENPCLTLKNSQAPCPTIFSSSIASNCSRSKQGIVKFVCAQIA